MPSVRVLSGSALPSRLRDVGSPPDRMFVVGSLPRGPIVAIVGTRTPTAGAKGYARQLAADLARRGVVVASGGAEGIDAAAHRGALDGRGGTVVVAPCSWDRPFPEKNAPLFETIVRRGGAFLTPYESGTPARPDRFFLRNEYLAALCSVLVVVETRLRGGARNAARHARRLGRVVFAVPAPPWNGVGRGCIAELQRGARPLASYRDVLAALRAQNAHPLPPLLSQLPLLSQTGGNSPGQNRARQGGAEATRRAVSGASGDGFRTVGELNKLVVPGSYELSAMRARVLGAIGSARVHPDDVCQRTGLPSQRVQEMLLTLTLEGILVSHACGRVSRVKN